MPKNHNQKSTVTPFFTPDWTPENVPHHPKYQDIYFNKNNGLEESHYVYAAQNNLPERFATTEEDFIIAELGFGTGLNLFLINDLWQENAQKNAHLTYITYELNPLESATIQNALKHWYKTENSKFFTQFLAQYAPKSGWNTYTFPHLTVHLAVGDVTQFLPEIKQKMKQNQRVNAWLLDGFTPARNPKMWSGTVYKTMGATTAKNGTFATFTAAAAVRNGLAEVGFLVEKTKGYGHKRTMLKGVFNG